MSHVGKNVSFDSALVTELIAFAGDHRLTFSAAIALLCREALDARKEGAV